MPTFKIEIKEILKRTVEIEAESVDEAINIAEDMYNDAEIVLDADDLAYTDIKEEQVD